MGSITLFMIRPLFDQDPYLVLDPLFEISVFSNSIEPKGKNQVSKPYMCRCIRKCSTTSNLYAGLESLSRQSFIRAYYVEGLYRI